MTANQKSTLVASAYRRLRTDIRENRLAPGFQAPEPEIATRLGMSRTPVREALIRLQADGLVRLVPRHGPLVIALTPSEVQRLYDVLSALEPEAAVSLADAAPDTETLSALSGYVGDMAQALDRQDPQGWLAADDLFHQEILSLQTNPRLHHMVSPLLDHVHRVLLTTLPYRDQMQRATEDHQTLLAELAAGNANGARRELRQHRKREGREVMEIIAAQSLTEL
ncbi:GntR family transcriptional regulator [Shimia sp. SDUM112013]|uniref:GntR family transcriptional regulator n=1 Tax=Shimia sp. SDUM112013 TaxID=3136160 RepID=UPI0032EFD200